MSDSVVNHIKTRLILLSGSQVLIYLVILCLLNHFRSGQGLCLVNMHREGLAKSADCEYSQQYTIDHVTHVC